MIYANLNCIKWICRDFCTFFNERARNCVKWAQQSGLLQSRWSTEEREFLISVSVWVAQTHTRIMKYSHPFLALPSSLCVSYRKKKKKKNPHWGENEAEMARAAPALTSFDLQMLRARIFLPTAHEIWSRMWTAAGVSRGELLNSKMSCICWGLATQSRGLDAGGFSSFLIVSSPPGFVLLRVVFLKYWLKQTHFGQKLFQYCNNVGLRGATRC